MTDEPMPYLVAHLHDAMMTDERLNEQAIEIVVVGSRLELRGEVATPERREAALALVREMAPDIDVIDDLCVSRTTRNDEPETL